MHLRLASQAALSAYNRQPAAVSGNQPACQAVQCPRMPFTTAVRRAKRCRQAQQAQIGAGQPLKTRDNACRGHWQIQRVKGHVSLNLVIFIDFCSYKSLCYAYSASFKSNVIL